MTLQSISQRHESPDALVHVTFADKITVSIPSNKPVTKTKEISYDIITNKYIVV